MCIPTVAGRRHSLLCFNKDSGTHFDLLRGRHWPPRPPLSGVARASLRTLVHYESCCQPPVYSAALARHIRHNAISSVTCRGVFADFLTCFVKYQSIHIAISIKMTSALMLLQASFRILYVFKTSKLLPSSVSQPPTTTNIHLMGKKKIFVAYFFSGFCVFRSNVSLVASMIVTLPTCFPSRVCYSPKFHLVLVFPVLSMLAPCYYFESRVVS